MAETCWICNKEKGQPPERCPGHSAVKPLVRRVGCARSVDIARGSRFVCGRDALCMKCAEKWAAALKVIHTWATFEDGLALDPEHVANLCSKTLYP